MVISDFKVFIVFVAPFLQVHLSVFFLLLLLLLLLLFFGGGGQQASSLSSKHKLWNFHRYSLVHNNTRSEDPDPQCTYVTSHLG